MEMYLFLVKFSEEKKILYFRIIQINTPSDATIWDDMKKEDSIKKNKFFKANNLNEKWIELPDVKPRHIIQSGIIKYIFTGNLYRTIYSNPKKVDKILYFFKSYSL